MSYNEKYLKYKKKYLALKKQLGGENIKEFLNRVLSEDKIDFFRKIYRIIQVNEKISDYKAKGLVISKEEIINLMIVTYDHEWLRKEFENNLTDIFAMLSTNIASTSFRGEEKVIVQRGLQLNIPSFPENIWNYLKLNQGYKPKFISKVKNEVLQSYSFNISPIFNIVIELYWDNDAFTHKSYHEKQIGISMCIGNYILGSLKIDDEYIKYIPWESISISDIKEERLKIGLKGVTDILNSNKDKIIKFIKTKFEIDNRLQFIYRINNKSRARGSLLMNHNTSMTAVKSIFNSQFLKVKKQPDIVSIIGDKKITELNRRRFEKLAEVFVYQKYNNGEIPTGDEQIIANWFYEGFYDITDGIGTGPISLIFEIPRKISQAEYYVLDLNKYDRSGNFASFNLPEVRISNSNEFPRTEEGQKVYQITSKFLSSGEGNVYTTPFDVDTSFIKAITTDKEYEQELRKFLKDMNINIPLLVRD